MRPRWKRPSLSTQVLIGLVLGVATGIFFGERATAVDVIGQAFVRLLQMSVIPYVVVSLMAGIGRLDASQARGLALRAGSALLVIYGITWTAISLFPLAFPSYETASFFSSALVTERPQIDLLSLYIPANPFDALVNGIMPSVVLFSLCVGIALISLPNKRGLVDHLGVLADSLMKLNTFVVGLAPIGVFALIASAAGTITLEELSRLQVFVITFAGICLLMTLWVLPGFVAALTPLRYRDVILTSRDALVTAFATGSLLVVLPILAIESRKLSAIDPDGSPDDISPAEVVIPVAYNFPSAGKLLGLSFILFAGWFSGDELELTSLPTLLSVGTFTFFGPNAMAVPFLLDMFRLPSDLFEVFLAVDVLTGRFAMTLAAMHILAIAVLTGFAFEGQIRIRWANLLRWALFSILGLVVVLVGSRIYFERTLGSGAKTYQMFIEMELRGVPARVRDEPPPIGDPASGTLGQIRSSGVLEVCYPPDSLPFAFVNEKNQLVGYDIDVMHALAHDMGVDIYFHREDDEQLLPRLQNGRCHIVVGGIAVTPQTAEEMSLTRPYLDNTLAFVVRDHDRHSWATWSQIRAMESPRITIPDSPHYVNVIKRRLPNAELVEAGSLRSYFRGQLEDVDALVYGAEAGGAWTLVYPSFSVVVPKPNPIGIPLAYAVRLGEWEWLTYLNTWVELQKRDGTLDELFDHWILGRAAKEKQRRWSVAHDVLGWLD